MYLLGIRSVACFGAAKLHIIGSMPNRSVLNPLSGSLYDFVEYEYHSSPLKFLEHASQEGLKLVSAELTSDAINIHNFEFKDFPVCFVVGHEESGIPPEILRASQTVFIPMSGIGFCLNTSQAANIVLYEATKQYESKFS